MPRKANNTRSKKAKADKEKTLSPANPGRSYELWGLAWVAVGLISLGGLFDLNVGFVGLYFAKFLHYFFGVGAVLICVLILLIGYQYITKRRILMAQELLGDTNMSIMDIALQSGFFSLSRMARLTTSAPLATSKTSSKPRLRIADSSWEMLCMFLNCP